MGFPIVGSGLLVALLAVLFVVGRVLWPKEWFQQRRDARRFASSVREMRDGLDFLAKERYSAALTKFKDAAAKTPRKPAPVLLRIYALGLEGRRREAAAELQHARQRWPVRTLPRRLLALAQLGAGEFDRAYQSAQAAAAELPIAAAALRTLGDVCRLLERYPEAERAYRAGVQLGEPRPYAGLAWVMAGQGQVAEAEAELSAAPEPLMALFEARLTLGQIHLQARRLDDALSIYRVLLREHGDVPRVLVPYGIALLEVGDLQEARATLAHAVHISGEDPFAHAALARLFVETDDLAHGTVHVREALRLWPGYGAARVIYGDILKRASRYDAAEEQYREALRLNPFLAEAHDRLATLLRARGASNEAREYEREAQRLRPTAPREITQKILAVTTRELAAIKLANGASQAATSDQAWSPSTAGSAPRLPQAQSEVPAVTRPRAARSGLPTVPAEPSGMSAPQEARAHHASGITVFPGALLLAGNARDAAFSQTFQTPRLPREVLDYYRQQMQHEGWWLVRETPSALSQIDGVALHFIRDDQEGVITVGTSGGQHPQAARATLIVTQFTYLRVNAGEARSS